VQSVRCASDRVKKYCFPLFIAIQVSQQRPRRFLKVRALQEGMPYQTLVSSVIRKYLSGRLVEKEQ